MNKGNHTPKVLKMQENFSFCSGFGQKHTNKHDTNPYTPITWEHIRELLENPQSVAKEKAQWVIFSDQLGKLGRDGNHLKENAKYGALWADIDETSHTMDDMAEFAQNIGLTCFIHTSSSATEEKQKFRLIFPLAEAVPAQVYLRLQKILNDRLEKEDITPDRATERVNQLCYLPNRGEYYDHRHVMEDDLLEDMLPYATPEHFQGELDQLEEEERQREADIDARREESRKKAAQRMAKGDLSPIDAFNEAYSVELMLDSYGYVKHDRWLSPLSESGNPGVSVSSDGRKWFSNHESDKEAGIGRTNDNGCFGDAFDLFKYFEHDNDQTQALEAAGKMFTTDGGLTLTQANQRNFMEKKAEAETQTAFENLGDLHPKTHPEAESGVNTSHAGDKQSSLPEFDRNILELPGLLGEMQNYIYGRMIYPCKAMAGVSALAFMAHFAQDKAYLKTLHGDLTLNEYWVVMAKTGYGKESLTTALYNLSEELAGRFATVSAGIQYSTPASQQGLHQLLESNNVQTFLSDEFAEWLIQSSKGGDSHKQGTVGYLMQIYTKGKKSVNVPNAVTTKYQPVKNPRVTIFATTTGERLAEALTGSQADSGSYNRFVMFVGNPGRPKKRYEAITETPSLALLDGLEEILKLQNEPIEMGEDAKQYYIKFDSETIEPLKFEDSYLAARLSEQALKLAGLITLAGGRTVMNRDDLRIAYQIRLNLYERAKAYIDREGGLSGDDSTVKAYEQVADLITKHRTLPVSQIGNHSRKYKNLKIHEREMVINHIQKTGIAAIVKVKGGNKLIHMDDLEETA